MSQSSTNEAARATRKAVKRPAAETYVLLSLTAFGITVAATRIFLEWAGYPQIGNSVLHIAHALWGGLLLFVAVLLPLTLANRWALTWSALLSGVGVGLFIDEVGKFITQKNDYFFPPAAPIIYAAFLILLLLFLFVRRSRPASPRSTMYRVLIGMQEALDDNLDTEERRHLLSELLLVRRGAEPHIEQLANLLTGYLNDPAIPLTSYQPGFWTRTNIWVRKQGERIGRKNHRRLIIALAIFGGISGLLLTGVLVAVLFSTEVANMFEALLAQSTSTAMVQSTTWRTVQVVVQALVGMLYLVSVFLYWRGREAPATGTAIIAALLSFTVIGLLNFYLNQFSALLEFFYGLPYLLLLLAYRAWYLTPQDTQD